MNKTRSGSILAVTLILGGLIGGGLSLLAMQVMQRLEAQERYVNQLKAFYAAESGVEQVLLELQSQPLAQLDTREQVLDSGVQWFSQVENRAAQWEVSLFPEEKTNLWLMVDSTETGAEFSAENLVPVSNFVGSMPTDETALNWQIRCPESAAQSAPVVGLSGSGTLNSSSTSGQVVCSSSSQSAGCEADEWQGVADFLAGREWCLLSVESSAVDPLNFIWESTDTELISGPKTNIEVMGKAGNSQQKVTTEKTIKTLQLE